MKKLFTLLLVLLLTAGMTSSSQAASTKIKGALDLLVEAPDWFALDKDAAQVLRFDLPKMIPSSYRYGSDPEDILEAAKDQRNRYELFEKKTKLPLPLSAQDLIKISGDLRGDYLLYALFEPQSPTNVGPWDSLTNSTTLKIILVNGTTKEVLFEKSYLCVESPDEIIEVQTQMGIQTRKGNPDIRLTPAEVIKSGLRKAIPEVKTFLEEYKQKTTTK